MIQKETAEKLLKTYEDAWVEQDIKKILSIFKEDGIYHKRVLKQPFVGHKQIAEHWKTKVVEEQSNIQFKLLNYYIEEDVIIAEWDAWFDSNIEKARMHIKEVGIIEVEGSKIRSIREYWQSEILSKNNRSIPSS